MSLKHNLTYTYVEPLMHKNISGICSSLVKQIYRSKNQIFIEPKKSQTLLNPKP
jgi:hypothetical protein